MDTCTLSLRYHNPARSDVAAVALAHGVNANLLRRWIAADDHKGPDLHQAQERSPEATAQCASSQVFVPVQMASNATREETIRIERRRGTTTMTITWPATAAADCAAWIREVLR